MRKRCIWQPAFSAAMLLVTVICTPSYAAESAACLDLERAISPKAELSSIEINARLFRAAGLGCIRFARTLPAAGASVEARDRLRAMPLAPPARARELRLVGRAG